MYLILSAKKNKRGLKLILKFICSSHFFLFWRVYIEIPRVVFFFEVGLFFVHCKLFNIRFSIVIWSTRIPLSNLRLPGYSDAIRTKTTNIASAFAAPWEHFPHRRSNISQNAYWSCLARENIVQSTSENFATFLMEPFFRLLNICMVTPSCVCQMYFKLVLNSVGLTCAHVGPFVMTQLFIRLR